ncbi:MAG: anti-sigma factor family protein [Acidimicrobiales bacterium]
MQCDDIAVVLPRVLDGTSRIEHRVVQHVETCLRCQAELARYRRMLRLLGQLRSEHPGVPPDAVGGVLLALHERAGKGSLRSALIRRRLVLVGGLTVATLAAAGGTAALALSRSRAAHSTRAAC